jgi:hypothetical protein
VATLSLSRSAIALEPTSADSALVVGEHERCLDVVGEALRLRVAEHSLEEGEDALRGRRVWRERKDDASRYSPIPAVISRKKQLEPGSRHPGCKFSSPAAGRGITPVNLIFVTQISRNFFVPEIAQFF